ncbi:MAG: protein-lysine N-methyltransferase [Planctomycetaceae bacterium]|nr:protein-lysine N-methyltransferase [Planctomycetaceae bacterium]
MDELHDNEQYFFDEPTLEQLAEFVSGWSRPCCLCAPLLGQRLASRGVDVTILDVDRRFATTPGFHRWDLHRPQWLGIEFDLIICDPPFFNLSLFQLFTAIRTLACNRFEQSLLLFYLQRRSQAVTQSFARFGLTPTGYCPQYQTVQNVDRNVVEMFGNLSEDQLSQLL